MGQTDEYQREGRCGDGDGGESNQGLTCIYAAHGHRRDCGEALGAVSVRWRGSKAENKTKGTYVTLLTIR